MKEAFKIISAAILGSALTVGSMQVFDLGGDTVKIEHTNGIPSQSTFFKDVDGKTINFDFTATAEKVMPAVVAIKSTVQNKPTSYGNGLQDEFFRQFFGEPRGQQRGFSVGAGSGVIISDDGYIVTNNHVVRDARDVEVALTNGKTYKAEIIGLDPSTDLALIKIKASNLPTLKFVDSDQVKIGQWVMAAGNPFNLTSTATAGIVSAKGRSINILKDKFAIESFIQTDAAINPGNSGGALVDISGGLIGINTAIASPTGAYSGYGFAVPANIVSKVVEDLIQYGSVKRGILGVSISTVDGNVAREKDLTVTDGVYVNDVSSGSGAEKAGIQAGDVITSVNGKRVAKSPELQELIARRRPGDKVTLTVNRKGKEKEFKVTLMSSTAETQLLSSSKLGNIESALGAEFETVSKELASR
ncbi:MAG: trypsin-like peptidase domain-containing protein, partial [Bacteroidota bacterium]